MRRKKHGDHANHERWLVSYADFITLLFAFFVVLYASSKADQRKQAQFAQAVDAAFNALGLFPENGHGKGAAMAQVIDDPQMPQEQTQQDLKHIRDQLQKKLGKELAANTIAMQLGHDGLVISLREAGFFDSGAATPHPSSIAAIGKIAKELAGTPYNLRIEGHTDNVPIHNGQFDTNWELSTARATRIARIFIENFGIAPARLSASGYAEYHPIASNDTAEGRAQNRRVDIIVLPHRYVAAPVVAAPQAPALNPLAIPSKQQPAKR
jgi:chemotaxis protein MotB